MLEYKLTCSAGLKMFLTFLLFVFSRCCCRGFVSSFLNRPHTSQSWRLSVQALNMLKCDWCGITSNNIGSKRTVTGKEKKKAVHHFWFVLYCFNLFQQVLFESLFFCCFFFSAQKTQKLLFISLWLHMSYHHVNSVFGCGTFFDLRFSLCPCLHNDILH